MEAALRLEPGPMTAWELECDGLTDDGLLDVLQVGPWVDRVVRSANRNGRDLRVVVVTPSAAAGVATKTAAGMIRDTLEIYDQDAQWV